MIDDLQFARYGTKIIADTSTYTIRAACLNVLNDTVIDTAVSVCGNMDAIASLASKTIPAGTTVWGNFTTVKLTSGVVQAIKLDAN